MKDRFSAVVSIWFDLHVHPLKKHQDKCQSLKNQVLSQISKKLEQSFTN